MSRNYDNWERLVAAVLKREQLWQMFHSHSRSPSISSESSGFSLSLGLSSSIETAAAATPSSRKKLLRIEPQEELTFRFEPRRQNSCTVRLFNNSQDHVAFKVMSTNPEKYRVRPTTGLLLPRSNSGVKITMHAPEEASSNTQCKDRFLIKSVAVNPDDTAENSRKLFEEEGHMVHSCKLRVVYEFPSRQQPSNIESVLNGTERRNRYGRQVSDVFIIGIITAVLLCLIFGFLITKMLPLIWSLGAITMMLVVKMMWKLVSDSVEDWLFNALLNLSVHFISVFSRRRDEQTQL